MAEHSGEDPGTLIEAAIASIYAGDVEGLRLLLDREPELVRSRRRGRTLLHIATDWPGHRPNAAATITLLVAAGADPNAAARGKYPETPLHWAASSDDVDAIAALIEAGADVNVRGAVIAGGTPMADATAFGQWKAARLLLEHGATTTLFEAATLGLVDRVRGHLEHSDPSGEDITSSFWGACHGGQVATAEILLDHGADLNWIGYDDITPLDAAVRSDAGDVVDWLRLRDARSADFG